MCKNNDLKELEALKKIFFKRSNNTSTGLLQLLLLASKVFCNAFFQFQVRETNRSY